MVRETESPDVISVASYNVHRCIGTDGRKDPDRIARVIEELGAELIGLQEVAWVMEADDERNQIAFLVRETGMEAIVGPTMKHEDGVYGNALLTSARILEVREHDLSVAGREPRGAIDARLEIRGLEVRSVVTHLGLSARERVEQTRRLVEILPESGGPVILMGDFNLWASWGRLARQLQRRFGRAPAPASYPARRPLLALDRVWIAPRERLISVEAHRSPLARVASDHLPVKARFRAGP